MIIQINKPSIYELEGVIKKGDLLISKESDFDLTEGRIYVALSNQGENTFYNCVFVKNDEGIVSDYTNEYFAFYEGERVVCDED